jgi:hypothetical protein
VVAGTCRCALSAESRSHRPGSRPWSGGRLLLRGPAEPDRDELLRPPRPLGLCRRTRRPARGRVLRSAGPRRRLVLDHDLVLPMVRSRAIGAVRLTRRGRSRSGRWTVTVNQGRLERMPSEPPRIRKWSVAPPPERWLRTVSALVVAAGPVIAMRSSFIAGAVIFSVGAFVLTVVSPAVGDRMLRSRPGGSGWGGGRWRWRTGGASPVGARHEGFRSTILGWKSTTRPDDTASATRTSVMPWPTRW